MLDCSVTSSYKYPDGNWGISLTYISDRWLEILIISETETLSFNVFVLGIILNNCLFSVSKGFLDSNSGYFLS